MKTKLIIVLLLISVSLRAQLIHVEGSKAIGFNVGYVKNGLNYSSRITFYKNSNFSYRGSLEYEKVNFELSKASILFANPELMYTFHSVGERLFLNVKGGILSGAELIFNSILDKKKNQFFIGENFGICAEYFLSGKIMINMDLDQRFFQISKVGKASFIIQLGLNYNF